jgi:predicted nucleotidyltransferase
MSNSDQLTAYPEVLALLQDLLARVRSILGNHFVGQYLFGSLANGGFDRDSDVDVLVVTDDVLSADLFAALQTMQARIAALDVWCATQLEVSYIPQAALRRFDPANNLHPHLDRGRGETLYLMQHDSDWVVQRYVLRERGITLAGPAPHALIDPVSPDDLRQAMLPILRDWLAHFLDEPDRLSKQGNQSYTVLSLCRILYTLDFGLVISKPDAARWARENLGEQWIPLIDHAWSGRQHPQLKAQAGDVNGTLDFIRFALERSRSFEIVSTSQHVSIQ